MRSTLVLLIIGLSVQAFAEEGIVVKVPGALDFADMRLKLTDDARKEIQKEVDMLTKSPKYYQIKADRIKLYFPIIEKVFREEGVPEEFKFLAVQESALISDAVSSANAVGFWQFKDFTGREVGLRIDKRIDERLNIVSSTIGVSKYFKRHNFYFDNWVYTLLAHMTGRGGAESYVDQDKFGSKRMVIDRNTHWYIKRFLAHMIAFQEADQGKHSEGLKLSEYKKAGGLTLKEIADQSKTDFTEVKKYNKWLKSGAVPRDKPYAVLIPSSGKAPKLNKIEGDPVEIARPKPQPDTAGYTSLVDNKSPGTIFIKINGISSILATTSDDMVSLAAKGSISVTQLAKYNDMDVNDRIEEGSIYYLKPKRGRAFSYFHTVIKGEDLWTVSQKFGIKMARLARLNRMEVDDPLEEGRVLWLRKRRPEDVPVEIRKVPLVPPVSETIDVAEVIKKPSENVKVDTLEIENSEDELVVVDLEDNGEIEVIIHEVEKGESLYAISKEYGVSIQDIVEWNGLKSYILDIGQKLALHVALELPEDLKEVEVVEAIVPEEDPASSEVVFHVVEPGDTVYGISKKYSVPVSELLELNQKENFDLKVGERLRLKEE